MLPDTFLSIQQGQKGSFVSWLEDLGLKDLIKDDQLPKLVEWGWLVPLYSVAFSDDYFDSNNKNSNSPDFQIRNRLLGWGESWCIENDEDPHWFLHPFCRPNGAYDKLLNQKDDSATTNVDYFFNWQAYALIDVVRAARQDLLNTPNIEQDIEHIAKRIKKSQTKPIDVLSRPHQWGGFAKPMTWLSHYRAFRDALPDKTDKSLHKKGAEELARYLEIDADILEKSIKEQLLEGLAGSWLSANEHYCKWTLRAWPYLQTDIFFAMEWLCRLNGKHLNNYFEKWQFSHKREVWPPLHKVLPFEGFEDKQYFLCTVPFYKKLYKDILPSGAKLDQLVSRLQKTNYPFDSLLYAFRQFHEYFNKPIQKGSLDFRVLRPLDYYSLLAIRAETCLRFPLNEDGSLNDIKKQGLDGYIKELSKQKKIPEAVITRFNDEVNMLTMLHKTPENPIVKIMKIECEHEQDTHLVQAFLCCVLARNYFAHHTYLDKHLLRDQREESAFMLIGILVTVLKLLDDSVAD